ncbi:MAG TPA: DNA polymerase I [Acidobacteria bacterium]|nr:DNA polymerase I [Acidobacteriota bacterium]
MGCPPRDGRAAAPESATGAGAITGVVVAADTGQPVRYAYLRVTSGELRGGRAAVTDANGRYRLEELPPGRYTVTASKTGFVPVTFGQRRVLEPGTPLEIGEGETLDEIDLALPRGSVITGQVVDEVGEPLAGVGVRAMRHEYRQGERRLAVVGADTSDDRGQYRVYGLAPGTYYVSAVARFIDGGRQARGRFGRTNQIEQDMGYAPSYYPGVTSASQAMPLTLGVAQEMTGVSFGVQLVPTVRVAGLVLSPEGAPSTRSAVSLVPDDGARGFGGGLDAQTQSDGTFTVRNVPPGRYLAVARSGGRRRENPLFAVQSITVAGGELSGLTMMLSAGATVGGGCRLRIEHLAARGRALAGPHFHPRGADDAVRIGWVDRCRCRRHLRAGQRSDGRTAVPGRCAGPLDAEDDLRRRPRHDRRTARVPARRRGGRQHRPDRSGLGTLGSRLGQRRTAGLRADGTRVLDRSRTVAIAVTTGRGGPPGPERTLPGARPAGGRVLRRRRRRDRTGLLVRPGGTRAVEPGRRPGQNSRRRNPHTRPASQSAELTPARGRQRDDSGRRPPASQAGILARGSHDLHHPRSRAGSPMNESTRRRLLLVDGSSQMYRAYHAIRGLTGPDGRSTNAVYGFVTMLRKLLDDQQPDYVTAAFDVKGPTFREELDAEYKANRAPMPDDLVEQVPWVHEACEALGVPVLTLPGYEADDVIGTLTRKAGDGGLDVVIVTGDKDFFQLVGNSVTVFNPKDDGAWFDPAGVEEKFGVRPDQVVDVLALMGDAVDNVKGVPGIGEKGARALIGEHGTLEALLAGADALTQRKYRTALTQHAESARQSRDLVRIHVDAPIDLDLERARFDGPDRARCFELFSSLGFRTLLTDYAPTAETTDTDYRSVSSLADLEALSDTLAGAKHALHLLTDTPVAMRAALVGLAFATSPRSARYVPIGHTALDAPTEFGPADALARLKPALEDPAVATVAHDLKFAAIVLRRHGIQLGGLADDPMLASYALGTSGSGHRLEDIALGESGYLLTTEESIRGKGAKATPFGELPVDVAAAFAGERADQALQLSGRLRPALAREGVDAVYRELELPLVPCLVEVEQAGVRIDTAALAEQSAQLEGELARVQARVFELAGEEFNINSPKQLAEVLFEKLDLPASKRTGKTRATSTAVAVLEELAQTHELPRLVLEWRSLQKLKGTYVDALPLLVHPDTGRVHTSFNQAVAATGRLSSSDPNLQNIPIRTELGRRIRGTFVAEAGHVLVSADYSQVELRVLAHLSGDASLIAAFQRGDDIHDQTAEKIFGSDSGLDPHELRRRAKIVNYALLYGKTAFTLAKDIGVDQSAAQEFIDAYFDGFPDVRVFIERTLDTARASGVVTTLYGRRRLVPALKSRKPQERMRAERETVNMPIQGTAADILKRAMIALHADLADRDDARMILTVHDELLFEVRDSAADALAALVKDRMEHAATLDVPLTVDVGVGPTWKDAKS